MRRTMALALVLLAGGCTALLDVSSLDRGGAPTCDGGCGDATLDAGREGATSDALVPLEAAESGDARAHDGAVDGCVSTGGPTPVRLIGITEAGAPHPYCIDSTEVTMAQYQAFLDAVGSGYSPSEPAQCAFNTGVAPKASINGCTPPPFDPVGHADLPVVCVNWCDAVAFCAWAGKRLCGTVGGGSMGYYEDRSSNDEWFGACSDNGANMFPWGDIFVDAGGGCNTACRDAGAAIPVASATNCPAPNGVYDQSGNVSQWVNSCQGDASTWGCAIQGNSFDKTWTFCGACDGTDYPARDYAASDLGIRCCGDAL